MKHKEPEIRKSEILDAAQKLFIEKGYVKTTVTDILSVNGLSKGVFYYYFKSKEDVMDAVIERIVDATADAARKITENPNMTANQKLCAILTRQGQSEETVQTKQDMIEKFRAPENAEMHQRSIVQTVKRLAPIMAPLFQQNTGYPEETMGLLLAAGHFVFDKDLFGWNRDERSRYACAFAEILSKAFGVNSEYFDDLKRILQGIP